jgi:hypothetical protein
MPFGENQCATTDLNIAEASEYPNCDAYLKEEWAAIGRLVTDGHILNPSAYPPTPTLLRPSWSLF